MITTGPSFASEEESLSNDLCATLKRNLAQPTSSSTTSANNRDTITSTKKVGCIWNSSRTWDKEEKRHIIKSPCLRSSLRGFCQYRTLFSNTEDLRTKLNKSKVSNLRTKLDESKAGDLRKYLRKLETEDPKKKLDRSNAENFRAKLN